MQRLRGDTYVRDGALPAAALRSDGRHVSLVDRNSWHILAMEDDGEICGCARYLPHDPSVTFSELVVRNSALAHDPEWCNTFRKAVDNEISMARSRQVSYVEVGGWALNERVRFSCEALRIALSSYALARKLGGCIGISTATLRNCSSSILERIGGSILALAGTKLPIYYDPQYRCEMAMLRFDADQPNPRYESAIRHLERQLETVTVVAKSPAILEHLPVQPLYACA